MADEDKPIEVAELAEDLEVPRFRDAVFGIRSVGDIKAILTEHEYEPHVHLIVLLTLTFLVGALSFLVGA